MTSSKKLLFFLLVLLSLFHRTTSQGENEDDVTPSYIPMCKDGYALGEGNGNSRFLGIYPTFTECVAAAQIDYNDILANSNEHNSTSLYPGVSFALQNMCYVVQTMNMTNGDPYIKTCYFAPPNNNNEDRSAASDAQTPPLVGGDPIIVGWKGQTFKFDGEDGKWYSNLETTDDKLHWNMQFRKFSTCPSDENMFISGLSILSNSKKNTNNNKILIQTTPEPIPECLEGGSSNNCLGGGTLHLSFDEGRTFISQPGDYSFPGNSRIIAHNTYSACSREWFDYALTKQKEEEEAIANEIASEMRLRGSKNYKSQSRNVKKPYEYMLDNTATMIDPTECKKWIHDRKEHDDIFQQPGLWSTIYIETPLVSFHIEYRQSNPENSERKCDFQSLDAWISELSPSLEEQEWHGILGETKNTIHDPTTGKSITNDRYQLLRGPNDADYEVDGPFGTTHIASTLSSSS